MYVCAPYVCLVPRRPEEGVLQVELQRVVSHHVDSGNQNLVLWKSKQQLLFNAEPSLRPLRFRCLLKSELGWARCLSR